MSDRVTLTLSDGIAHVRLNRPEKHNALDKAMFEAISRAQKDVHQRTDVRCVVLSGEGDSFSAGLDVESFADTANQRDFPAKLGMTDDNGANIFQRVGYGWRRLPVPVVTAIHGHCYGGGLQIALGGDLRVCSPQARLSLMEIKWGLIPDMAASVLLRDLVRRDVAMDLMLTGRVISGDEAHAMGLVTRLADAPLEQAQALARQIAAQSPDAVRAGKLMLNENWAIDDSAALALEARLQARLLGSANHREARTAGMQQRQPSYADVTR